MRNFVQTSASQVQTFKLCPRKWYFEKIMGLPQLDKDYLHWGTAIHAIAERYLSADDAGRDPLTGKTVELFPEGWEHTWSDKIPRKIVFSYSPSEMAWVKHLTALAIEKGIWERRPNRQIEYKFETSEKHGIGVIGYLDVLMPGEVWDHKSTKNRKYAKGPDRLRNDEQILLYAKVALDIADKQPGASLDTITVRHNIFVKDQTEKNPVYKTEIVLTRAEINAAWRAFEDTTEQMIRVSKIVGHFNITDEEIPAGACRAFGGCPFLNICTRTESFVKYQSRVNAINSNRIERLNHVMSAEPSSVAHNKGKEIMGSLFSKLENAASPNLNKPPVTPPAAVQAPTPAPAPTASTQAAVPAPEVLPQHPPADKVRAPWYAHGCPACRDNLVLGFNSAGNVCRLCRINGVKNNPPAPSPDNYKVMNFDWEDKPGAISSKMLEIAAQVQTKTPAQVEAVEENDKPEVGEVTEDVNFVEAPETIQRRGPGRPKGSGKRTAEANPGPPVERIEDPVTPLSFDANAMGETPAQLLAAFANPKTVLNPLGAGAKKVTFTMLIGCAPIRISGKDYILGDDLFAALRLRYCEENGIATYWDADPFKRRDSMCYIAGQIADKLSGAIIVFTSSSASADIKALQDALKPYAQTIIQSVIG